MALDDPAITADEAGLSHVSDAEPAIVEVPASPTAGPAARW